MKKSTVKAIAAGSSALVSAGTVMAMDMLKDKKEENNNDYAAKPNIDDEVRKDEIPSPDADEVDAEKGLSLLDHQYRSQWQANGFPQTHEEMRKLEEEEKNNK